MSTPTETPNETSTPLRGLSLWQPWATLIALRAKRIETRSWGTPYRGNVLICATASTPAGEWDVLDDPAFAAVLRADSFPDRASFPQGCVVAVAKVVACDLILQSDPSGYFRQDMYGKTVREEFLAPHECSFGNYAPGRYAWVLSSIRALTKPVPCRGAQGLWLPDVETRRAVAAVIGGECGPFAPVPERPAAVSLFDLVGEPA